MRVAYVTNTFPNVSTTFVSREIEALERRGAAVDVYAMRRPGGDLPDPADRAMQARTDYLLEDGAARLLAGLLAEAAANPRGVLRALRLARRLWRAGGGAVRHAAYLAEAAALRRRLRARPADHLHAHFSTNATAVAALARAMGGPGYSFALHGPSELWDPAGNGLGLKVAGAAFVACISHFARAQAMIFSDPAHWGRLRIVRCGVAPARFAGPPPAEDGLPARRGGGRALFVGRLAPAKGGPVLIEAMARLARTHPGADLVVIGDGPARGAMEDAARAAGIADRVHLLGVRSGEAVRAAMAGADMLVLPSFAEGVPVVLMEAMASARPVVATRVAGVGELVEDGVSGLTVPPGDAGALAAAIARLLDDPGLRARMGAAGRRAVAAGFDVDAEAAWLARLVAGAAAGRLPEGLRPGAAAGA